MDFASIFYIITQVLASHDPSLFSTITVFVSHVGTLRMLVWEDNIIMAT